MEETQITAQVSVLIVSYNCASALRRCLQSVEASTGRDKLEVLVVDNGSVDGSAEVVSEFPRVVLLKLPRNFGFVKALNIGMRTAKAEFYFYLSPHAEVLPDTISALADRLSGQADAVAVCPLLTTPQGSPAPELYRLPDAATVTAAARNCAFESAGIPELDRETIPVQFAGLGAFMVRSYFLKGLRYIDERYAQSWADAELAMQVRRANRKILLCPDIRAIRHEPAGELARSAPPNVRGLLASDWALGAAVYAGKHFGFPSGVKVRLAATLGALASLLSFGDVRYRFSRFANLVSGRKIDGTQRIM
jgi:N-acetylglucosaminyl-diphospho-decaprenol L-rhamnosyltransferase